MRNPLTYPFRFSLRNKLIALVCGASLFTSLAMGALIFVRTGQIALETAIESLEAEARLISFEFKDAFKTLETDVTVLAQMPPIAGIMRSHAAGGFDPVDKSTTEMWRNRLAKIFSSMLQSRPEYTQIRFIGAADNGREIVRVNQTAGGPYTVEISGLQQKATEPYYRNAVRDGNREVYFSEVTLNREFGAVDDTRTPTLRAVLPVFTPNDTLYGVIVINADYPALVHNKLATLQYHRDVYVVSGSGDYMAYRHGDSISKFYSYAEEGYHPPDFLPAMMDTNWNAHTFLDRNGAVSLVRVATGAANSDLKVGLAVLRPARSELFAKAYETRRDSLILAVALLAVSIFITAWAATRITQPLRAMTRSITEAQKSGQAPLWLPTHLNDEIGEQARAFADLTTDLLESEGKTRAVVAKVVDGIITIDAMGVIDSYNPACERMFGYTAKETIGQNIRMLMPPIHSKRHEGYLAKYMETRKKSIIGTSRELEGQRKDGSTFPIELSVSEIVLDHRRLFTGVIRDITERKQMEVMKDEFISTVNHELRTPLTSIKASLEILMRNLPAGLDQRSLKILDISHRNCERLGHLVNDILDLEKIAAGKIDFKIERTEMGATVRDIVERHQHFATQYGVKFRADIAAEEVYCRIDSLRFNQALVNLLSNAAKFSPEGECVTIATRILEGQGQDGGVLVVSVADNGPGIPDTFRSKIFERFAQADSSSTRAKGGTGLGLNITKSIIEAFGGRVTFETAQGKGSTFFFHIPISIAPQHTEETPWQAA